jgi:hypothetical protein
VRETAVKMLLTPHKLVAKPSFGMSPKRWITKRGEINQAITKYPLQRLQRFCIQHTQPWKDSSKHN